MRFPFPSLFRGQFKIPASRAGALAIAGILFMGGPILAQTPIQSPLPPMKKASESIRKQEPAKINQEVLDRVTPENASILIVLNHQRAYLMLGDEIAVDTPVSTGKKSRATPPGKFTVQEKDADHRSNLYGDFVDSRGRVVRAGVSSRVDSAPSGTRFEGAPMKWFLRVNGAIGIHVGILPGYPASHGCIRMPANIAPLFYKKVKLGTPVEIRP